ncbi:MAG: DUF2807 domain-containing protein [Bacteroidetes bacterium HGW-Bacteroidetes-1]|jgi:hypothetical protein|nr:MAG: DUF2807 domain-containing protein [Bacteroidetes bacterium HGW-Bacteroidetes-1]
MKTKNFSSLSMVAVLMFVFLQLTLSCSYADGFSIRGSGNKQVENRTVGSFSAIDVSGGFEVILTQGSSESLQIEADDNLMNSIITEVKGGELRIYIRDHVSAKTKMKAYINFIHLDEIEISGAVKVFATNKLNFKNLELDASGASEIDLELELEVLEIDMSGATKITLNGTADKVYVDCSGASKMYLSGFKTAVQKFELSGASYAEVWVTEELIVEASGASEFKYKGEPKILRTDTSGASSIRKM